MVFLLAGFFLQTAAGRGQSAAETRVTLSSFAEPVKVPLNRTATWTVRITWEDALGLIEIAKCEDPVLTNFDIIGSSASNRRVADASGQTAVKEISYTLAPRTLGMAYIESAAVSYRDRATGETHHLMTQRIGVEVTEAVPEPGTFRMPWLVLLLVLVLAGGFFSFRISRKKFRDRKTAESAAVKPVPEEVFLAELKSAIDPAAPGRTETLTDLMKLYRRYLAEKYDIPALETTTSELVQKLGESGIDPGLAEKSESLFARADILKFSGREATQSELDEAYTTVETVLETHLRAARDASGRSNGKAEKE